MAGQRAVMDILDAAAQLRDRLDAVGDGRLAETVRVILSHALAAIESLKPSEAEFDAFVQFLTDVGYATDARRQEWVLLADVFGLSAHLCDRTACPAGATPSVLRGPFYRPDSPMMESGANLSRDGVGMPVVVRVTVKGEDGAPVCGAEVEVWHANGAGLYENQDPDNQPEHNLRGRFRTDADGQIAFRTIRPAGYRLPDDGPVGRLACALGLSLDRPAHIHFAVAAPGFRHLVTAVFDSSDPAIGRDALYSVRPGLIGAFRAMPFGHHLDAVLVLARDADGPSTHKNDKEG